MNKTEAVGIVAEFNPFHSGHRFLIDEIDKNFDNPVKVSVMSGDFTERGEPAVCDKWTRAEDAVRGGIDLVCQLPFVYASNSAGEFARGAVSVLESFGNIDILAFGSETGDIDAISSFISFEKKAGDEYTELIRKFSRNGFSYPVAREKAADICGFDGNICGLFEPNNILALEYMANLDNIEPFAIKRMGKGYHESASEIRRDMALTDGGRLDLMNQRYFDLIRSRILLESPEKLEDIFSSGEGLGFKLKKEIRRAESREELISLVKSKRYTYTRISRLLLHVLTDFKKEDRGKVAYIRPLAMNQRGATFLKEARKNEKGIFLDNINKSIYEHPEIEKAVGFDVLATDIYNVISRRNLYRESDYVRKPSVMV